VARLAARWFAADEAQHLATMPTDDARRAFLRLWTAKEASCKATGTGIFGYLSRWRFDPATETWTEFSLPIVESDARRIELDPTNPNRIWWSGDTSTHLGYIEVLP